MADKPEKDTDTFLAIYEGGNGQIKSWPRCSMLSDK